MADAMNLPTGVVTFLLTDVEASTRLWRESSDAAAAMQRHATLIADAVARHGGVQPVEQGEGDSTVSAFARASDALYAALAAQRALRAEHWPAGAAVRVRMAVHTGEAELRAPGLYGASCRRRVRRRAGAVARRRRRVRAPRARRAPPARHWLGRPHADRRKVVELVAAGLTNREIAAKLFVSLATVKTHLIHVFTKLDVRSRAELASAATSRAIERSKS